MDFILMKKNKRMPFTAYLIVVTFISTLEFSAFNFYPYRPYFLAMALLFLVIHIGINMKELANNWIRIALFLSAGISYLMTGETVFSLLLITVSTTPDREYVYYFKIMVTTQIILTVISIVLAVCGIIPNICIERDRGWGLEQRYALGFGHPNNFANQTFSILLLLICINKDKFTYKKLIVAILIICGNFYLTRSRTVLILSVFIISAICFGKKYKKIQEIFYKVVNWVLPMAFSLSIILPYIIYDIPENSFLYKVIMFFDKLLMHRLLLGNMYYKYLHITMFGKTIDRELIASENLYSIVDSGYLNLLFNFGIFSCIIFILFYFISILKLREQGEYIFLLSIIAMILLGITENMLRTMAINFTFLFWMEVVMKGEDTIYIKKEKQV